MKKGKEGRKEKNGSPKIKLRERIEREREGRTRRRKASRKGEKEY